MIEDKRDQNFAQAASKLKAAVDSERAVGPASLDDLIELLDADDLQNVIGMLRPKGRPGQDAGRGGA